MIKDKYNLEPSQTIFIDDIKENVKAAMKSGLKRILLNNPKDLRRELEELNVDI